MAKAEAAGIKLFIQYQTLKSRSSHKSDDSSHFYEIDLPQNRDYM